jgi:hypothetical protein
MVSAAFHLARRLQTLSRNNSNRQSYLHEG